MKTGIIGGSVLWLIFVTWLLTGCAGMGVSANMYRIDKHQESHQMKEKSWACVIWNSCGEGSNHGS